MSVLGVIKSLQYMRSIWLKEFIMISQLQKYRKQMNEADAYISVFLKLNFVSPLPPELTSLA